MREDGRRAGRLAAVALLGAVTFAALHALFGATWERWFSPAELGRPWFLGSRRSLIATQAVLAGEAFLIGLAHRAGWRRRLAVGGALAGGAFAAAAATFFALGPEELMRGPARLWPVALGAAAVLLGAAVAAGTLAAGLWRRRGHHEAGRC